MGAWRGDFSSSEWLQLAACFLGVPLAALIGAWLAQAQSKKTGVVFGPMLSGLGVAAGLAILQFVGFLVLASVVRGSTSLKLLPLFESYLGRVFVAATLTIALVASFVIGIRANGRADKVDIAKASFTIRQFFLLQLFCFMVLGCWTSMRLVALRSLTSIERAQRKWSQRDWKYGVDPKRNYASLETLKEYSHIDYVAENAYLRDAAKEDGLTWLSMGAFRDPQRLDLAALKQANDLKHLRIYYAYDSQISTQHLSDLSCVTSLEELEMKSAGSIVADLSPLAKLPHLRQLLIRTPTIAPADLAGLSASPSIRSLTLEDFTATDMSPLLFSESIVELNLQTRFFCTLSEENFRKLRDLTMCTMSAPGLTRQEMAVIASAPRLEFVGLGGIQDVADLELFATHASLKRLRFTYLTASESQFQKCAEMLQKLALCPKLEWIECDPKFLVVWGDSNPDLMELVERGEDGTIRYGKSGPRLLVEARVPKFQAMIDELRANAKLGKLEMRFSPYDAISAPVTQRQYFKKTNAPGAKL